MDTGMLIANRILALCTEKNITLNKLSFLCGITQSTLNNIIHGGSKNPTVDTVRRICTGLNMPMKSFFDTPEFDAATRIDTNTENGL
ncbi:MAG: helix-turn-helix transcriptional regulator [Clostridia bacterium]|nr:helix-turn-helix transcriptional regulator [Clostridia bacterium]